MSSLPLKMFSRQREIIHAKAWDHKTTHVVRKITDGMASVKDTLGEGETDTLGGGDAVVMTAGRLDLVL